MRFNKRFLISAVILLLVSVAVAWFEIRYDPTSLIYFTAAWVLVVLGLLWLGNRLLTRLFNRYLSWLSYGNIRFFVHLFCGIVYSLVVINGTYAALKYLLTTDPPTQGQVVVMNVYGAILFIPVFSIYFSLHFLRSWRRSEVEAEKFQKESMRAQLESLKSHLDPHFLFNNLNILSSLIDRDKESSKLFLDKFAEVYRLLLRSRAEDLITLREELNFIESYSYLLHMRFGDSIQFSIDIPETLQRLSLPPLTLQMLVENAIKHTLITERRPLLISIRSRGDQQLSVSNTLNEKPSALPARAGSGLDNIRRRYQHFTSMPVDIEKTGTEFQVTIPLLDLTTS